MDDLLTRAQRGTPIIEEDRATFVWQGHQAPQLIGDLTGWESGRPLDLEATSPGIWTRTLTLPMDAYVEYAYCQDGKRIADPLNSHTTPDGFGNANHFFYMPGNAPTPLLRRRRNVARGSVTHHTLQDEFLLGRGRRPVRLYRPVAPGPYPLLVVLDGQDYARRGRLIPIVDNLIAEGRIQPLAMALIDHGGPARAIEYGCSEAHLAALLYLLLPLAQKELDLESRPGVHGILGASMGGLMALYAGLRVPPVFGRVLSQSGAFTLNAHETVVWDLVRHGSARPLRIWMDAGRYEWLLDCNRSMHLAMVGMQYDVTYREFNGGHNYTAWQNDLSRGLESLFRI